MMIKKLKQPLVLALGALFAFNLGASEINTKKSVVSWRGQKVSGEHQGTLRFESGEAKMSEGELLGGSFVVDMSSLDVNDLEGEWKSKFLTHMKSGDFFNTQKYPTSKLVISEVKGNTAKGILTIKDKTSPVNFTYKKDGKAIVGAFTFDRTKFGMIYNSGNFFKDLGDKLVKDQVEVNYRIVLKK